MKSSKRFSLPKIPKIKSFSDLPRGSAKFLALGVVGVVLLHTIFGPKGLISLGILLRECKQLETEIAQEKSKIDSLTIVVGRLQGDASYLERSARELLGVSSSGETVIKFVDQRE